MDPIDEVSLQLWKDRALLAEARAKDLSAALERACCVGCGKVLDSRQEAAAHVELCAKHPLGAALERVRELEIRAAGLAGFLDRPGLDTDTRWALDDLQALLGGPVPRRDPPPAPFTSWAAYAGDLAGQLAAVEAAFGSGPVDGPPLAVKVQKLLLELGEEVYHHAACLSIAEGAPGWETFEHKRPASRAVATLRRSVEDLTAAQLRNIQRIESALVEVERLTLRVTALEAEACRFYRPDGTYEVLPPAEVVERRILAARRLAQLEDLAAGVADDPAPPDGLPCPADPGVLMLNCPDARGGEEAANRRAQGRLCSHAGGCNGVLRRKLPGIFEAPFAPPPADLRPGPCRRCDGTGKVGPEGESWKAWLDLPLSSSIAVVSGIVRPSPCPECGGGGKGASGA